MAASWGLDSWRRRERAQEPGPGPASSAPAPGALAPHASVAPHANDFSLRSSDPRARSRASPESHAVGPACRRLGRVQHRCSVTRRSGTAPSGSEDTRVTFIAPCAASGPLWIPVRPSRPLGWRPWQGLSGSPGAARPAASGAFFSTTAVRIEARRVPDARGPYAKRDRVPQREPASAGSRAPSAPIVSIGSSRATASGGGAPQGVEGPDRELPSRKPKRRVPAMEMADYRPSH